MIRWQDTLSQNGMPWEAGGFGLADGYVVGSAAVRALAEGGIPRLNAFLTALRGA